MGQGWLKTVNFLELLAFKDGESLEYDGKARLNNLIEIFML